MELGICTQEITRDSVYDVFETVREYGFKQVQFNMLSVCGTETPESICESWVDDIVRAKTRTGIDIVAINGVFNMIHPDINEREKGIKGFAGIAGICKKIGCGLVSLNTGTGCAESMWKPHPYNDTKEAWAEMLKVMERVLIIAEQSGVDVGVEPEASNVVNSARKAACLINELASDRIKIIMDCANLFHEGEAKTGNVKRIMEDAFELLGSRIAIAHGKDIAQGDGIEFVPAGKGIVDFVLFRELLLSVGYKGSMILHGFNNESEIAESISFMNKILA